MKILVKVKGGPGSGNYDHAGIPGSVGGSAPSGTVETYDRQKFIKSLGARVECRLEIN